MIKKVVGSVVDSKLNLIGLSIQGKASEFGVMGAPNEIITRNMYLADLAKNRFRSAMLSVVEKDGAAKVVYNSNSSLKLRDLPMQMLTANGLKSVSNKANIVAICYNGNTNSENIIGYKVKVQDNIIEVKRDSILQFSELFELDFKVATDSCNRPYIMGKPHGKKKDELDVEILHLANPVYSRKNPSIAIDMDFITLMKLANQCEALVLMQNKKTHASEILAATSTIATPKLKFTLKSLNVNLTGILHGKCLVDEEIYNVKAFKTVNIIKNGKVNIKELKLALTKDKFAQFIGQVGCSVSFVDCTSSVSDADMKVLKDKMGDKEIIVLSMNISEIPLMTTNLANKHYLKAQQIDSVLENLHTARICKTLINDKSGALKLLAELEGVHNPADKGQTLSGAKEALESGLFNMDEIDIQFRGMDRNKLLRLVNAGINVYTGFYETSNYRSEKDTTLIEIEYANKYSKLTGFAKINEALLNNDYNNIPSGVSILLGKLAINRSTESIFNALKQYEKVYELELEKLALHKIAMCELTGYTSIQFKDADEWEISTKYRGQGNKYYNKKSTLELTCICKNIAIR